jgi:Serine/threonine protein phosphatase
MRLNYIISAKTDKGIKKSTNQDSLTVKTIRTANGRLVFALVCDGMGGLLQGEVASAAVVRAFDKWVITKLPKLCNVGIKEADIISHWTNLINEQNAKIRRYGEIEGIKLGTTITALLLTDSKYYIANIGDSRVYELTNAGMKMLTKDQTVVEREVEYGNITREEAKTDARRSVLLQCCGVLEKISPDIKSGNTKKDAVYMICSDGFRHEISDTEIYEQLNPKKLLNQETMETNMTYLIELNKQREERDNISVITIRTF